MFALHGGMFLSVFLIYILGALIMNSFRILWMMNSSYSIHWMQCGWQLRTARVCIVELWSYLTTQITEHLSKYLCCDFILLLFSLSSNRRYVILLNFVITLTNSFITGWYLSPSFMIIVHFKVSVQLILQYMSTPFHLPNNYLSIIIILYFSVLYHQ